MLRIDQFVFERVVIRREAVEDIIDFAKANHPKEFGAFLSGSIKKKVLHITGLLYQPYVSNENEAILWTNLPLMSGSVGSVHSHPGNSNKPSTPDLRMFSRGLINIIICKPYTEQAIAVYDGSGRELPHTIE